MEPTSASTLPQSFVVLETDHWRINHRVDVQLPGYLILAPKDPSAVSFAAISPDALAEMGSVLAKVAGAMEKYLQPKHLYVGRYGHSKGHNLHLHLIPIYEWVVQAFSQDPRYRELQSFHTPGVSRPEQDSHFDGAEMTLFVWREFAESLTPPPISGPSISETIRLLKDVLNRPVQDIGD